MTALETELTELLALERQRTQDLLSRISQIQADLNMIKAKSKEISGVS